MRIRGWHVEGFGLLQDFRVDGLPDGLTVVLGPNEAGKTSLLAFIRGALFGYPDRRRKDRQYPPLRGGRHGGRLLVEADESIWTVERFASPAHLSITQPSGALGTEADLRRILGGVDAELYRNVFAFSLSELQEFESLQVEGVKDRIFAAGVVGAGRSARTAIDSLVAERSEIGRKRGECRINNLRRRADELDELLRAAKARAARHPEIRRAAEAIDEERNRIGEALSEARRELGGLDALLAAWPDWDECAQAASELATLEDMPDLAEDLAVRLSTSAAAVGAQRERYEERRQKVVSLEQRLIQLVPDDLIAAVSGDVKRLSLQIGTVRARREKLGEIGAQCDALMRRVEEEAPRLGAGWSSRSVREFDASIPAAQEISNWGEQLRAAESDVREAEEKATQRQLAWQDLAEEASRRATLLASVQPPPETQSLIQLDASIRLLRVKLADLGGLRVDLHAANQRVDDITQRAAEARELAKTKEADLEISTSRLSGVQELPDSEDLARRARTVRELRSELAALVAARAELRSSNQRALGAKQQADDAIALTLAAERELQRRIEEQAEAPPIPDAHSIAMSERAVRELRLRLGDLAVLRTDYRAAEIRLADRRRDADRLAESAKPAKSIWWRIGLAGTLCIGALALLFILPSIAAAVAFGAALLATILGMITPSAAVPGASDLAAEIAEAEGGIQEISSRIQEIEALAVPVATRLGFGALPDQDELEAKADEIVTSSKARFDRDRESESIAHSRREAERYREAAKRLVTIANNAKADADNTFGQSVRDLEEVILKSAERLGFGEIPTPAALEEKDAEIMSLLQKRRDRDAEVAALRTREREVAHLGQVAERLERQASELRNQVQAHELASERAAVQGALEIATPLGFQMLPEPAVLEAKAKEIDDQMRGRQEFDRETLAVEDIRRRMEEAALAAHTAAETAADCRRASNELHTAWAAWKVAHKCPEALRPETAQQFFASVNRLREGLFQFDQLELDASRIIEEIQHFTGAVHSVVQSAGVEQYPAAAQSEDVLEDLKERVEAETQLRAEHARVVREQDDARIALKASQHEYAAAESALAAVLDEAGAANETDCRLRIASSGQRAAMKKRMREAEHRLRGRLGVGVQADAIRAELASGDRQGWEVRKHECKGALARLQPAHEDAVRRHQTAIGELTVLERESDVVAYATEREGVIAEIRDALTEWRRLTIAQSLVQGTLRRYELERQPAVLVRAASGFERITEGRYTRLVTREDGVDVIAADGSRLDAAALSRGTAEQLYLCLRLALAAEFGRLAVPLPLVMDDVLVNFDPERARLAAEVLLDATHDHQMLLFTCHPGTVDLLFGLAPNLKVIEINRNTPTLRSVDEVAVIDPVRRRTSNTKR